MTSPFWALAIYTAFVFVIVGAMLGLSFVLGERHHEHSTGQPYEAGILSSGSARIRFAVRYYLIAMFFLIFDLESVFLYVWAVVGRSLGWAGYLEIVVFIGVLLAALIYLWRRGLLDVASPRGGHSE